MESKDIKKDQEITIDGSAIAKRDLANKKKKNVFYYINPKNLIAEIEKMGVKKPIRTIIMYYFLFALIIISNYFLFNLKLFFLVLMIIGSMFVIPLVILNHFKKSFEDKRFEEVSQYIEQLLYSFSDNRKVLKSLQDIYPLFKGSMMGDAILEEINDIEKKGLKIALENFNQKYDCQKIEQVHNFLLEVENMGGNHSKTIDILIKDKQSWAKRVTVFKKERKNKYIVTVLSILLSYLICAAMIKMLPSNVDITKNIICQISSTLLYFADLILFYITDKKASASILNNLKVRKDSEIKTYYEYVINYDAKREFLKSMKMIPVIIIIGIVAILIKNKLLLTFTALFTLWVLFHYKITYKMRLKAIKEEINIQFPRWLMQMALLVQFNSVQVALYKSIPTAGLVLQPELIKLNNSLRENPTSVEPYLDFMKDFNMPDITASVKMFYAVSSGAGADTESQVNNIIEKNNILLDETEKIAYDNTLGGMYILFLAPQLIGGAKALIDMMIFFVMFIGSIGI